MEVKTVPENLLHSVISLPDVTSYDKYIYSAVSEDKYEFLSSMLFDNRSTCDQLAFIRTVKV